MLFENLGKGKFREVGVESGTARVQTRTEEEQASMAVAVGEYDNNGYPDILVTDFSKASTPTLYQNNGDNTFSDSTFSAKLGLKTQYLSWGTGFVDFDNDGRKDLFIASGHVLPGSRSAFRRSAVSPGTWFTGIPAMAHSKIFPPEPDRRSVQNMPAAAPHSKILTGMATSISLS